MLVLGVDSLFSSMALAAFCLGLDSETLETSRVGDPSVLWPLYVSRVFGAKTLGHFELIVTCMIISPHIILYTSFYLFYLS